MATTPRTRGRRPWGSLDPDNTGTIFGKVPTEAKAFYDELADGAGVSMGVLLEAMALHFRGQFDSDDVSAWLRAKDMHEKAGTGQQEALDISAA
jgi:hypothetical protein